MNIIGHKKIIKLLDRSLEKGDIAHAYIFSGPTGVGKFTVALNFSGKLLGADPSSNSERVNPDLMIIAPEIEEKKGILKKRDIKIERIRDLQHQIALSSYGGKHRVVIIDEADRLNKASQNALLKTLEEPSAGLVLILVVQDEKRILPTIMSRCQKIKFGIVSQDDLEKALSSGTEENQKMLFWALGRPGLLLEMSKNKEELNFRNDSLELLKSLFEKEITEKFQIAEKLSKDIGSMEKILNLWIVVIRNSLIGNNRLVEISRSRSLELINEIEKSLETIRNTNSNARLALENLLLNF